MDRQLQQLFAAAPSGSGAQPLTAHQLRYALCVRINSLLGQMDVPGQKLPEALAAWRHASGVMLALEPDSPRSLLLATNVPALPGAAGAAQYLKEQRHLQRGLALACQQGSAFWETSCATRLLTWLVADATGSAETPVQPHELAEAIAAARRVPRLVQRCRRRLPEVWVRAIEGDVGSVARVLPVAEAQLRLLQAGGRPLAEQAALLSAVQRAKAAARVQRAAAGRAPTGNDASRCDNCGQMSVGLKRCSRCRSVSYCR